MILNMSGRLKTVVDSAVPFLKGVLEPYSEVVYRAGFEMCREDLLDADALIIGTRTKCGRDLLEGTPVKLIATATIGTDHIDVPWCDSAGIIVTNAAGCDAGGVMNYVFSALYGVASRKGISLEGKTIGIVGVGHVGKLVDRVASSLGFNVMRYDPPREKAEGHFGFTTLDNLLSSSDIVTLHVPHNPSTFRMADESFFSRMKEGAIFINSARGEIVDDLALKKAASKLSAIVIDTWNHEPDVDRELIDLADIATPHIAGYSYKGKQNGAAMSVKSLARYFSIEPLYDYFPEEVLELESVKLELKGLSQGEITSLMQYNYPIFTDDFLFRMDPSSFDSLRSGYQFRREFYVDF